MRIACRTLALLYAAALVSMAGVGLAPSAFAQAAIDPAFLNEIQGRWVSRFENDDTEFEISGREIRAVRVKPANYHPSVPPHKRYNPQPGDLIGVIESSEVSYTVKSLIAGKPDRTIYRMRSRCVSDHGDGYRMTAAADCSGGLGAHTHMLPGLGGFHQPVFEYRTLSPRVMVHGGGDFWRPEVKREIFGGATTATAAPVGHPAPPSGRSNPAAPVAAAAPDSLSIPVTSEQDRRELAERERLNREQAEFGTRQLAENEANRQAFEQAVRDREATIARQQADYEAQVAAVEAERQRREREHTARMAQWRADVEACKKGDKSKCAQ